MTAVSEQSVHDCDGDVGKVDRLCVNTRLIDVAADVDFWSSEIMMRGAVRRATPSSGRVLFIANDDIMLRYFVEMVEISLIFVCEC